jgi:hypothetical protein
MSAADGFPVQEIVYGQLDGIPEPDENWLEALSCPDATRAICDLSPAVLEYFYTGSTPSQPSSTRELTSHTSTVPNHQSLSPDSTHKHRSCSESSVDSNLTDLISRDENAPDHHKTALQGQVQGVKHAPFQTVMGRFGNLSASPAILQSVHKASATSSAKAGESLCNAGETAAPQSHFQDQHGSGSIAFTDSSAVKNPCTACTKQPCSTPEQRAVHAQDEPLRSRGDAPITSVNIVLESTEKEDQGTTCNSSNKEDLDRVVAAEAAHMDAARQEAPQTMAKLHGGGSLTAGGTPGCSAADSRQSGWLANELFPETNFEDSEDDGGCVEMFKSCMNDHSAYDTKRSLILELSATSNITLPCQDTPPVSDTLVKDATTPLHMDTSQRAGSAADATLQSSTSRQVCAKRTRAGISDAAVRSQEQLATASNAVFIASAPGSVPELVNMQDWSGTFTGSDLAERTFCHFTGSDEAVNKSVGMDKPKMATDGKESAIANGPAAGAGSPLLSS